MRQGYRKSDGNFAPITHTSAKCFDRSSPYSSPNYLMREIFRKTKWKFLMGFSMKGEGAQVPLRFFNFFA